jgi:hypothetical protein
MGSFLSADRPHYVGRATTKKHFHRKRNILVAYLNIACLQYHQLLNHHPIMNPKTTLSAQEERNRAVIASYLLIIKATKQLLSTLEQQQLRHAYEVDYKGYNHMKPTLDEFISPLCYLCLREVDGAYSIHFGFDKDAEYAAFVKPFIRMIYKLTMKDYTSVDIEDCIEAYSIITDISGLIDLTEWKHPDWPVKVIKHKPTSKQIKQVLSVV